MFLYRRHTEKFIYVKVLCYKRNRKYNFFDYSEDFARFDSASRRLNRPLSIAGYEIATVHINYVATGNQSESTLSTSHNVDIPSDVTIVIIIINYFETII